MKRGNFLLFIVLVIISFLFRVLSIQYPKLYLVNAFYTVLALTIIYLVFKIVLENVVIEKIQDKKTRYSLRKAISIIYIVAFLVVSLSIWVAQTQTLIVSFGLIAAGIAVSLQDFFKNIVGGITLFLTGIYRVGDRIEIKDKCGDVIDIGIMYTTLMETGQWIRGDQATGRLINIPNGQVLSSNVDNYTKDNSFIWDEITVPIKYGSDLEKAMEIVTEAADSETGSIADQAREILSKMGDKYYTSQREVFPAVYLTLTDNWIDFSVRYITDAKERRQMNDAISRRILEKIDGTEDVEIASETLDIIGFPDAKK